MGLPCKQVRFPENEEALRAVVCEVDNREDLTAEDFELLFYTKEDYQNSRNLSKKISRECERAGHGKLLEGTFVEKCSEVQERLNKWGLHGCDRRGLERWINKEHGELRQQEQFQSVMTVLQAQDEMLAERKKVDPEKLRKVSHKATKCARHFARMMGKADAHAVENENIVIIEMDTESIKTDWSTITSSTEKTDDDISLPRIPGIPDDLNGSRHMEKSKRLYPRLPNFLQRSRIRGTKVKDEDLLSQHKSPRSVQREK